MPLPPSLSLSLSSLPVVEFFLDELAQLMQGTDPPVSITNQSPSIPVPSAGISLGPGNATRIPVPGDPGPVLASYAGVGVTGKRRLFFSSRRSVLQPAQHRPPRPSNPRPSVRAEQHVPRSVNPSRSLVQEPTFVSELSC